MPGEWVISSNRYIYSHNHLFSVRATRTPRPPQQSPQKVAGPSNQGHDVLPSVRKRKNAAIMDGKRKGKVSGKVKGTGKGKETEKGKGKGTAKGKGKAREAEESEDERPKKKSRAG
jgi:hypothetical protein